LTIDVCLPVWACPYGPARMSLPVWACPYGACPYGPARMGVLSAISTQAFARSGQVKKREVHNKNYP